MATKRTRLFASRKPFRWTRAHLEHLPDDGNRYEVLDGKLLVTPQASVPHQWIAFELMLALHPYCKAHRLGMPLGPGAVISKKNELQPDVLVVPEFKGPLPDKWQKLPRPHLVIEVLSRTTKYRDFVLKREAYLKLGIAAYWVIDRFERNAAVWTQASPEPEMVTDFIRWQPREGIPPLEIPLSGLFAALEAPQPD